METEPSHIFDWYQFAPLLLTDTSVSVMLLNTLSIFLLLICSGLLSGSEVAYFSLDIQARKDLKGEKQASSARILALLDKPRYLLSTILIANNVVNIAIVLVSKSLLDQLVPDSLHPWLHFGITVGLVTFLLVLFGEIAPKVYATKNNLRIARLMSSPLSVMQRLFMPLSLMLVNSTQLVENRLRTKMNQSTVSREDITNAIELIVKDNKYATQDVNMLKGIVRFGDTSAEEIMCPRMKVVALDIEASLDEVLTIFRKQPFSRIPIYEETIDKIKGIIHAKDLLEHIDDENLNWHELIRPPLIIFEKKKIDDLFEDFQEKRTHMAIVVNEYGGTEGIVTLEDVLEEIVGEIQDEFDQSEKEAFDKIDDYTYDFDGSTPIIEICKVLDIRADFFDDVRSGAETIAGLILVLNGRIPALNMPLIYKEYHLITRAASKRRIEKVRIVLPRANNIDLSSSVS